MLATKQYPLCSATKTLRYNSSSQQSPQSLQSQWGQQSQGSQQSRQCRQNSTIRSRRRGQPCTSYECLVMIFNNIKIYLCVYHETFMRGHIFRLYHPQFVPALLPVSNRIITGAENESQSYDIFLPHQGQVQLILRGSKFDDMTKDLHPQIKRNIRRHIEEYLVFLENDVDRLEELDVTATMFGAIYRQRTRKDDDDKKTNDASLKRDHGKVDYSKLRKFHKECMQPGLLYVREYFPMDGATPLFSQKEQQETKNTTVVRLGYTLNLKDAPEDDCLGSGQQVVFPLIPKGQSVSSAAAPFAILLAGIIHELLVAHQYDTWCPCSSYYGVGTTHTNVYYFHNCPSNDTSNGASSFGEVIGILQPFIEKCIGVVRLIEEGVSDLFFSTSHCSVRAS